ncbi:MAG: hypothetical protein JST39_19575 [Bacteroidetes bacterium]|nr:hypothetical protein [Bacteroidota bacterium]
MNLRIRGLSISGGGIMGDVQMKGCSISAGVCAPVEARGFVLSATQTVIGEFNGIVISPLRNRSAKGRGMQLGLLNICKDMKGLQVGLWNVNSKRRLPLVNWNF